MYPITLTVSPGRSGTRFLYNTFKLNFQNFGYIYHEMLHPMEGRPASYHRYYSDADINEIFNNPHVIKLRDYIEESIEKRPVIDFGYTTSSLIPAFYKYFGDKLNVLVLHRHPILYAGSRTTMGAYKVLKHEYYNLTPYHKHAEFTNYKDIWSNMSSFERCLYYWLEVTSYGLELKDKFPKIKILTMSSDEIFNSSKWVNELSKFVGLSINENIKIAEKSNVLEQHNRERFPVKYEWKNYKLHIDVLNLAEHLGYNMEESYIENLIKRYQLPDGVLPYLRHISNFWGFKVELGRLKRIIFKDNTVSSGKYN